MYRALQEDVVCLFSAQPHDDSSLGYSSDGRGYLAAEGIGSRLCYLQPQPGPEVRACVPLLSETLSPLLRHLQDPHELWNCAFEVGGALSVHAMYTQGYDHVEVWLSVCVCVKCMGAVFAEAGYQC